MNHVDSKFIGYLSAKLERFKKVTLVNMGLKRLNKAFRPFSRILVREFKEINSETIAFQIAPRINAAGRMESAYTAYNFLNS
jgi:single-stranded-DNA-specific exonuclease